MTDPKFTAAAPIIFGEEGPFSKQAGDPGGVTKFGIARNEHPEIPAAEWAAFTQADALAIYQKQYFDAHRCGEMPWPWALGVFDGEVNQGKTGALLAQKALGLKQDGNVGEVTLAAMAKANSYDFQHFLALRAKAYVGDRQYKTDGDGWFVRLFNVAMASQHPPAA